MNNNFKELKLFSRSEASKALTIGKERLNDLIENGRLGYLMLGDRIVIPYREIERYINENTLRFEQNKTNKESNDIDLSSVRPNHKKHNLLTNTKHILNNILENNNGKHISKRK